MKLPNFLRVNKGDYKEENREVVGKMADSLNPSIESLYTLANNRITFADNMASVVKDITVIVDSQGFPVSATAIALNANVKKVLGSQVWAAVNQTDTNVYPTAQPFITFTQNGTSFEVNHIAGLPANYQFVLTVVIMAA